MAYKNFRMTEIIEEVGTELRKLRKEQELTLKQVSELLEKDGLEISGTLLGRIETGERRIDDDTLDALCRLYETDPASVVKKACSMHIEILEKQTGVSEVSEAQSVLNLYMELPENRKDDVRKMIHLFAYMDRLTDAE